LVIVSGTDILIAGPPLPLFPSPPLPIIKPLLMISTPLGQDPLTVIAGVPVEVEYT
jgi:hypothetical protein